MSIGEVVRSSAFDDWQGVVREHLTSLRDGLKQLAEPETEEEQHELSEVKQKWSLTEWKRRGQARTRDSLV